MTRCFDIATAVFALLAAIFWFLSAHGKLPPMVSYLDRAPKNDPLYVALKFSASMNTIASVLSGLSALCVIGGSLSR
jgi:hypothetical protein